MAHADVTVLSTFACLVSYYFWYKIAPHLRLTPFLVYEAIDLSYVNLHAKLFIACMVYSAHQIQQPILKLRILNVLESQIAFDKKKGKTKKHWSKNS